MWGVISSFWLKLVQSYARMHKNEDEIWALPFINFYIVIVHALISGRDVTLLHT